MLLDKDIDKVTETDMYDISEEFHMTTRSTVIIRLGLRLMICFD